MQNPAGQHNACAKLIASIFLLPTWMLAQNPATGGSLPSFEVASIRPSDPARCAPFPMVDGHNSRVEMKCVTLKFLLQLAYGVRDFQISGGPGWIGSTQYDIAAKEAAKPDASAVPDKDVADLTDDERKTQGGRLRALLQPFLADRFQLKTHRETKQLPVYVLTVAKGGPKLKIDEKTPNVSGGLRLGRAFLAGEQTRISLLVQAVSQIVGRPILDRTGLTSKYDFELKWTPDQSSPNGPLGGPLPPSPDAAPADPNLPTIFTAIQEQLGLKLDSSKGPVEIIVIDHVERPSEN